MRDAKQRALEDGRSASPSGVTGEAKFRWGSVTVTVRDTDGVRGLMAQLCRDLGIDDPYVK